MSFFFSFFFNDEQQTERRREELSLLGSIKGAVRSNIKIRSLSAHWGWRDNDWILNVCQWWSFLLCGTFLGLHSRTESLGTYFKTWNAATQFARRDPKVLVPPRSQTYFKRRYLPAFLKPTSSLSSLLKALACTPSEVFAHVYQINLGSQVLPETTESTWRHVWSHFYVSFQEETLSPRGCVNT